MNIISDCRLPLKEKTVITVGNFDGVHLGHAALINKITNLACLYGAQSLVWTFDDHPDMFKSGDVRLISDKADKLSFLDSLGVDGVYFADFLHIKDIMPEDFALGVLCRSLGARSVVCGYDFRFGANRSGTAEGLKKLLESHGVECIIMPPVYVDGILVSSTEIRRRISAGDVETALRLLGRNYSFRLPVIHGTAQGRRLGAPTINQEFPHFRIIPKFGVYAVRCNIDAVIYNGVANIGIKPTMCREDTSVLCETHIFDFDGDVYGKDVRIELLKMIREEKKFGSVSELRAAIRRDIESASVYFDGGNK